MNYFSVFDHFVGLTLAGLIRCSGLKWPHSLLILTHKRVQRSETLPFLLIFRSLYLARIPILYPRNNRRTAWVLIDDTPEPLISLCNTWFCS